MLTTLIVNQKNEKPALISENIRETETKLTVVYLWFSGCEKMWMSASTAASKCDSLESAVNASAITGSESGKGRPNCAQLEKQRRACSETADDDAAVLRYWCSSGTTGLDKLTTIS